MSDASNPPLTPSPCIGVCTIDEDVELCLGCARNLKEVAGWRRFNEEQRREVVAQLPKRKEEMIAAGVDVRWQRR